MKLSRLEKMRQAQHLALGHGDSRRAGGGAGGALGADDGGWRAEDAVRELGEYMLEAPSKKHDLLAYWKLHGTDTLDSGTGQVVLPARWPHLGLVARLYAGVDTTSRQGERHCGDGLAAAVDRLQRSLPPSEVEQMVILRLNKMLVM